MRSPIDLFLKGISQMVKRYKIAFNSLIYFAKNPADVYAKKKENYNELLDIASLIALVSILISLLNEIDNIIFLIIMMIIVIPLSRLRGWLTIRFYGYFFSLYISQIVFKRFIESSSNDFDNRRIVTYASVGVALSSLPFTSAWIIGLGVTLFLTKTGLTTIYNLTSKESWISALAFCLIWHLLWIGLAWGIKGLFLIMGI